MVNSGQVKTRDTGRDMDSTDYYIHTYIHACMHACHACRRINSSLVSQALDHFYRRGFGVLSLLDG